jgi:flagellar L-ring protein precursor FlgH
MNPSIKIVGLILIMMLLNACAATQRAVQPDPDYAPVDLNSVAFQPLPNGSIFQQGRSVRLFEDIKAFRIGDLLSINLSESTNASKSAATNTSKNSEIGTVVDSILGVIPTFKDDQFLTNSAKAETDFTGSGDSAQSNSLSGEITVTVADILSNGTLSVRGEKIIGLNQGAEYIRLSGLVRPQDVSANNMVQSRKLANARIFYGGGGAIDDSNTKGWLSRLFDSPSFPL